MGRRQIPGALLSDGTDLEAAAPAAPASHSEFAGMPAAAGGLVSETGSPIAHGPTVAREYGIPAVICVRDATTTIRTGDRLRMDGTSGTVERLPDVERSDESAG